MAFNHYNNIIPNFWQSENHCPVNNYNHGSPSHHRKPTRLKNFTTKLEAYDSLHFKAKEVSKSLVIRISGIFPSLVFYFNFNSPTTKNNVKEEEQC